MEGYWFYLETYTYCSFSSKNAILYNTLDGQCIEVTDNAIINLLREIHVPDNGGVVFLSKELSTDPLMHSFLNDVRGKYIGDIIDVSLSLSKPVQLLAMYNLRHDLKKSRKTRETSVIRGNLLHYLQEIHIYLHENQETIDTAMLKEYLFQLGHIQLYLYDLLDSGNYQNLLDFFDVFPSKKIIVCSYTQITSNNLSSINFEKYDIQIIVNYPFDHQQWEAIWNILSTRKQPYSIVFEIASNDDYEQAESIINLCKIEKYQLKPVYTSKNLPFFEENIFLEKEDILAVPLSMREIFAHQAMNTYDFGKISIMPNGDVHANVNHPPLGNIATYTIHEILYKEMDKGESWLRIRDQTPCDHCVYQWLCPSPSNYEIAIGRPNLCHIK